MSALAAGAAVNLACLIYALLLRQYHHRHNFYSRSVSSDAQKVAHIGLTNAEVRPTVSTTHFRGWKLT
eukprot:COSAG02_NODE_1090_length_14647_cov_122.569425_8_plen_68_part_00